MRRIDFVRSAGGAAIVPSLVHVAEAATGGSQVVDLRFSYVPLPASTPGYDPAGDAKALIAPSTASPALHPIPGRQYLGSYATGERYVIRVPGRWNGDLVVAGTPAFRSEFASDAVWGDLVLAKGYAYASSNKGIPVNAIAEAIADVAFPHTAYPIPFDSGGLESKGIALRIGALGPKAPIASWNDDYVALVAFARNLLRDEFGRAPRRTLAVGLSNGGAQVRTLLETRPDLVDGGVDWSGVYWNPEQNFLTYLPTFLHAMQNYVVSGFRSADSAAAIVAAGFPPDVTQDDLAHPSLWSEYYSNVAPFYADLTVYAYALLIDPTAEAAYAKAPMKVNTWDAKRLPGTIDGTGLARPEMRAAYVPSADAKRAIATFAHTGKLGRPLISIAGTCDTFITPARNAVAYADAVRAAGHGAQHALFLVEGGTHVDPFSAFGYKLVPQAPYAWAAFAALERTVHAAAPLAGAGATRTVTDPSQIKA